MRRNPCSLKIITWSKHSRRIEPMSLSTYAFCQGERGALRRNYFLSDFLSAIKKILQAPFLLPTEHRRALSDGHGHAPLDHRDFHGVVHDQARDYGIGENRERLRPRQWHESRKTHTRQDGPRERIHNESSHEGLAGRRRPERTSLARGQHGEHSKVEQQQEAEG